MQSCRVEGTDRAGLLACRSPHPGPPATCLAWVRMRAGVTLLRVVIGVCPWPAGGGRCGCWPALSWSSESPMRASPEQVLGGAGDGNRTRMASLEGWGSTIELHPHAPPRRSGLSVPAGSVWRPTRAVGHPPIAYALLSTRRVHRGVAQLGSALALGARGRGFESRHPDGWAGGGRCAARPYPTPAGPAPGR